MKYRVNQIREDDGLLRAYSASKLAKVLGCTRSYASKIKSGKRIVSEETYYKIVEKVILYESLNLSN